MDGESGPEAEGQDQAGALAYLLRIPQLSRQESWTLAFGVLMWRRGVQSGSGEDVEMEQQEEFQGRVVFDGNCNEEKNGYVCTLMSGHSGKHEAWGGGEKPEFVWTDGE